MKKRIIGYDLARAFAVFGMVVVNFKIVMGAEKSGSSWLVNLVGVLDGRAAATFVVLAGIGISLLSRKARDSGDSLALAGNRNTLLRRALFLFLGGLLYTPIWPADILHFYGVFLAVAAFLLTSSPTKLWILIGVLVSGFAIMAFVFDYEYEWNWETLEYSGFWTPQGMVRNLFYNGFHPVIPWLAFLLLGMVVGRLKMDSSSVRRRVFGAGLAMAVASEAISWLIIRTFSSEGEVADKEAIAVVFGTGPMPPMPFYMLAGAGTACAVIAASVSIGKRFQDAIWIRPFVATGQLALTLYVAHVVVGMTILEVIGRMENQTLPVSLIASAVFLVASVAFAHFWRRHFVRGPVEMLMRFCTEARK